MAATWRSVSLAVAFASGKSMLDIFNGASSAKLLKVYRAWQFNNGTGAVTGVLTTMRVNRITAASAGSAVTPIAHDTSSAALDANSTSGTGRTTTASDIFRQWVWSNDEPAVSGTSMDEWELLVPFAQIWESGYGDSNVEPVVCRAAQGFEIKQQGVSAVGTNDFEIEFTNV